VLGVFTGTANAAEVPRVTAFPVVGNVNFINDWHDPRPGGWHEGNDIMSTRHQPAVAFEKGRVEKWSGGGCMLVLHGASGMDYWYIHLNNDLGPTNDNDGGCRTGVSYAPGLQEGEFVRRGELVGYVGDSGDANGIQPHLHFEIHKPSGTPINPYNYLHDARRMLFPRPDTQEDISLVFRGAKIVDVKEGSVKIRTHVIEMSPSGWRYRYARGVTLAVPDEAVVERQTADGPSSAALSESMEGKDARVRSLPFAISWQAQRGLPGELAVERVLILRDA
jgi:Peptidase family M23